MKKVLATTMATLIFGVSVPVNTFALPNNLEKANHLEVNNPKEFTAQDFKGKLFDRDEKLLENYQNKGNQIPEGHTPGIIASDQSPNGKPQGYVTVTYKVDTTKAKFENENIGKSEISFYVYKSIGVKLNEVGKNINVVALDPTKHEIDKDSPWTIAPNSFNEDSVVTEDITLTANIKDLSNQNSKQERTIAERITKNGLYAADISVWMGDTINWKDGVGLDTSVTDPELKKAFNEASFEGDGRNSNNQRTSGEEGKIKVTFSDNSFIEVEGQKIYVFPHVTASTYDKAPKDAIITNFFLGEGTKVVEGSKVTEGDADHPTVYKTYKVKPGTDLSKYNLPTNQNVFDNIFAKPLDDSYSNVRWEPNNFVVRDNNKVFTAKAIKRYKVTFEFQGLDLDTSKDIDAESLVKALKDKKPEEAWVEKGKSFNPTKPQNFTEIIKDKEGQVTKVYEWTFAGWNQTGIPSASKDEKLIGTWKRSQAKSAEPEVEKISELDKTIKGQGQVGAKIIITFEDNTSLETTVRPNMKWEVKINKNLKKNEKISITQIEKGKKESAKKEVIVSEKAKENKKPDPRPMPNPEVKPDKKPLPNPGTNQKEKNKQNKKENNYFGLRFKNHTTKATKVKTQVENKNINKKQREEARYIIDVMSGNYQVIKDGVRQNRKMDVMPQIKNDRLILPLRNIAEMIGAKVEWDPQTRTASFTNKGLVAKIQIDGNEIVLSNGKVIKMDSKPLNINGRILLPISNVANVFGLTNGNTKDGIDQNIEWDGVNKTVEINLNK
ncbi:MAG: stalk domain-containing protein [Peptoniphilus harei]|nr:stalk domain-containing protein [Peptoniphilus harei]